MIAVLALVFGILLLATAPAKAQDHGCDPGQVLGTARTMSVGGGIRVGLKTYPQTLDLKDHEVVLTFDDGPSSRTTPRILDALAAQCVKATFFLIGRNAAASAALVRREIQDGHTVGHHSWSHPAVTLRGLTQAEAIADIDRGMLADDRAAYGSSVGGPRVPFFRFPGFADTPALLDDLARRRIVVFGADLWASDWLPMTPEAELDRLMERLGQSHGGIVLLHDIKEETAEMLPAFLEALRREGYHVVRLVPGPPGTPLRSAPPGWTSETETTLAHVWPRPRDQVHDERPPPPVSATHPHGSVPPGPESRPLADPQGDVSGAPGGDGP